MATRLEILQEMLSKNPADSFARYGLAMELSKQGDLAAAVTEYRTILGANAGYLAAYYHGGRALEQLGRFDDARELYEQGIEAATRAGDQHTRSELEAALDLLG